MDWIYFIGLIAVVAVVMLVVGWIGNKAVDKTENAMRARKVRRQNENLVPAQPSRRLADQMTPQAAGQARQTTVFPGTQSAAPIPAPQTTAYPGAQTSAPVPGTTQPAAAPTPQPAPQERKARFCASCGATLAEAAKFCPMCGAAAESYRER